MTALEWAYDSWTVPWVYLAGSTSLLAPASHATLMVLSCEAANLERDRLARHLSAEECEHRMAAIRAEQDSAVMVRVDLRALDVADGDAIARARTGVRFTLEDDRGRRWSPVEISPGPVVVVPAGQKLRRVHYDPSWVRGSRHLLPNQYEVAGGHRLTVGQHRLRFARRDPTSNRLVIAPDTRWIRLRLSYRRYEWVATWVFASDPASGR